MAKKSEGFRSPENVLQRHEEIQRLRTEGLLLKQIAVKVGLGYAQSVIYHLNGRCPCEARRDGARAAVTSEKGEPA